MNEYLTPRDALNYASNMNDNEPQPGGAGGPPENQGGIPEGLNIDQDDRESLEGAIRRSREQKQLSSVDIMANIHSRLSRATGAQATRQVEVLLEDLRRYARALGNKIDEEKGKRYLEEIDALNPRTELNTAKARGQDIALRLQGDLRPFEKRDVRDHVHSLEELAELIMDSEEDKWRVGGELALLTEAGEVHMGNFMAWLRSRALFYDDFNPDSEINLFSDISIPTIWRAINFQEILSTTRYQMKKVRLVDPADPDKVLDERYVKDDRYEKLIKEQALYEVWLFMENHNYDAKYRANSGIEDNLQKTLAEIHYRNVFTKNRDRLLRIFKLPGVQELEDRYDDATASKFQGIVGKVKQRALLAYMYLPDRDMFTKVFTRDGSREGLDAFYESVVEQVFAEKVRQMKIDKFKEENNGTDPTEDEIEKVEVDLFGAQREAFFRELNSGTVDDPHYFRRTLNISRDEFNYLIDHDREYFARKAMVYRYDNRTRDVGEQEGFKTWNSPELIVPGEDSSGGPFSMFNIYSDVNTEQGRIDTIRKAVKAGVSKMLNEVPNEKTKLDIDYGETWAFRETYWTGIAGYNDINAIAFDKWGQMLNTGGYRRRQAAGRGPAGIEETIWGIERLGLNLWQGLKVRGEGGRDFDKILLEAIQGGKGDVINLNQDIADFDFQGNAQRQYMVDHISAGFLLAKHLIDQHGMDFDKFVKLDYRGKLIIDYKQFEEVVRDRIWHDLRYCYDQRGFLWNNQIRSWWREKDPETGEERLRFGAKNLKQHMFDQEVLDTREEVFERGKLDPSDPDYSERIATELENDAMARGVMAYLVGKELKWHTKDKPGTMKWGLNEVRMVKDLFQQWALGYEKDPKTGEVKSLGPFFSSNEWEETIAELGDATNEKLKRGLLISFLLYILGYIAWGTIKEGRRIVTEPLKETVGAGTR